MLEFQECFVSGQLKAVGEDGDYWIIDDELMYVTFDPSGPNEHIISSGSEDSLILDANEFEGAITDKCSTDL